MPKILELPQLSQHEGVAEMKVGASSTVIRVGSEMTLTSGLSALIVRVPDSTLGLPTSAVVWSTWR